MRENKDIDILVVEDDQDMLEFIEEILMDCGFAVTTASNGKQALEVMRNSTFPIVISDLKMPIMGGVALLEEIGAMSVMKPFVILITAFGDIDEALELINRGAYDYLTKPFKMDQLLITVRKAVRELEMRNRIKELEQITQKRYSLHNLIGKSKAMRKLFSFIEKISNSSGNVLLEGETGTGKEVIAKTIHLISERNNKPFIPINCAAIPEGLLESELFGHVKGAFTDAKSHKKGLFVEAEGGTVLLDEIGEMPLSIQAKMLRALQERQVRPLGSNSSISFDARIVAATNRRLKEESSAGRFREDLYYRLNIFKIIIPPLRERREDIPLLVNEFLGRYKQDGVKSVFSSEAIRFLLDYSWPGNIRELENVVERCVYLAEEGQINLNDFPEEMFDSGDEHDALIINKIQPLADMEKTYLRFVLDQCGGNKKKAASLLGINRKTIHRKLEE